MVNDMVKTGQPLLPPGLFPANLACMDAHLFRRFCDTLLPLLTGALLEKL